VNDKQRAEQGASVSLGETRLWIEALAEDAQYAHEVGHLAQVLNTEVYRVLEDSTQANPATRYL